VCRKRGKEVDEKRLIKLGQSYCHTEKDLTDKGCDIEGKSIDCSLTKSLFNDSTVATVWVCGQNTYHSSPKDWIGCCYPALLDVGTSIYRADGKQQLNDNHREKREVSKSMPMMCQGTKLWDPWTSRVAMTGWSFLAGGETAASLLKINGLAWQVLKLANKTEDVLNFQDEWFMGLEGWSRWLISVVAPVLGITLTAIPVVFPVWFLVPNRWFPELQLIA